MKLSPIAGFAHPASDPTCGQVTLVMMLAFVIVPKSAGTQKSSRLVDTATLAKFKSD